MSVVISTFNRENNIIKIINILNNQNNFQKKNFEIIICDSNSKKNLLIRNYIKQFTELKVNYFNCLVNHQAYKRNYGFKKALGKYVIFIDDDCFPEKNFLHKYYTYFRLNRNKLIYCGLVKYNIFYSIRNFIHYRQSRQISLDSINKNNIPPKNFVSMNMGLTKKFFYNKKYIFDNKFRHYGFEDYEFAYRAIVNSYKIILINSLVYHNDKRNFLQFILKYNYIGEYGITDIVKINIKAAQQSIFYKIENNFLINLFLNIPKINKFFDKILIILVFIEKNNFFYISFLYKFGIFIAYLKGVILRKKKYQTRGNSWYK